MTGLTDRELLKQRIKRVEAMAAMCRRQETRRRRKPKSQEESDTPSENPEDDMIDSPEDTVKDIFSLVCKKSQCIFCLGDERKPYLEQMFEYSRRSKMIDEVDKHLRKFAPNDKV